ncbi:hypothetical protein DY000_02052941 [Brassica cretica]|uniref:Calmodulin-binding domain-containing protein n=1 Tax=Brassica cretica TaxID=69181 RepID=A0ABQ7AFJ0_BRACR|nr:hypothetical protein DY000_02052941 [Brassica cretica]
MTRPVFIPSAWRMTNRTNRWKTRHVPMQSSLAIDDASSRPNGACDLRSKLKRKSPAAESTHGSDSDLLTVINEPRAKRVESTSFHPHLKPRVLDLRDQLNSRSEDLRIRLNRPKRSG